MYYKMIATPFLFEWTVGENGVKFKVNQNPLHILCEKYYSKGKIPPLNERITLLRKAGYSEIALDKIIKNHMQAKKDSEKNQKILDDIFIKYKIKPTKKKVLKPVKKI